MMSVQLVTRRITSPQIDTNCCIDHCQTANRRQNQVHGRPTWIGMSSVDCWLEIQTLHLHGQPVGWTLPPSSPMLRPGCAIDSTEPPKETARWATGGETSTPPTPPSQCSQHQVEETPSEWVGEWRTDDADQQEPRWDYGISCLNTHMASVHLASIRKGWSIPISLLGADWNLAKQIGPICVGSVSVREGSVNSKTVKDGKTENKQQCSVCSHRPARTFHFKWTILLLVREAPAFAIQPPWLQV